MHRDTDIFPVINKHFRVYRVPIPLNTRSLVMLSFKIALILENLDENGDNRSALR